jgi:hypothetical protein
MVRTPALLLASCAVLSASAGCGPTLEDQELVAVSGEGGVVLLVERAPPSGAVLVRDLDGVELAISSRRLVDPDGREGGCYRLVAGKHDLGQACAEPIALTGSASPSPPVMLVGESAEVDWSLESRLPAWAAAEGELVLRRQRPETGEERWLDAGCLGLDSLASSCWSERISALPAEDAWLSLPPYRPEHDGALVERLGVFLAFEDGQGARVLAGEELELAFLDQRLVWGDLHGHTNLSMDGCEDPEAGCRPRRETLGQDYFANAEEAGLDFAAITDHAEFDEITEDGGPALDIWDATLDLVAAAEGLDDFVPLLGFEWTHRVKREEVLGPDDDPEDLAEAFTAGHRTVILSEPDACRAYRLASRTPAESFVKAGTAISYNVVEEHREATRLADLYDALDDATLECDPVESLSWYHHPAMVGPNPVSWGLEHNLEQIDRERLVEVASEHGSSECRDPLQEGCEFRSQVDEYRDNHVGWGSIQEALDLGFQLGFVGGTDAHDGRPGSLSDGPSLVAQKQVDDVPPEKLAPHIMAYAGAITGAWISGGLERETVWEALADRRCFASTARLGGAALAAVGADGQLYLAGSTVPGAAFPLHLMVRLEPSTEVSVERIELVEPHDGAVLASAEGPSLELWLEDPGGAAVYLRARLEWEGEEHRAWFSPLFLVAEE